MVKKILFSAYSLGLGGIETALISLLKELSKKNEIVLILEKKEGIFLNQLENIKVLEYTPSTCKVLFFRKLVNLAKRINFWCYHHQQYDFSCSFATYSKVGSYCARVASKNSCLFVHNNYLITYENDYRKTKEFFSSLNHNQFKHIAFVSHDAKKAYESIFPDYQSHLITCNNLIDDKKIEKQAKEAIDLQKPHEETWFLSVGRHDEHQKKLSRLIEACAKLKEDRIPFKVIMLGEGKDTPIYQKMIERYSLEQHILLLGTKKNPYPYFSLCDAVILTSDYEGYPVVFIEAMVLGKPLLTTDVSDAREDIEGKYGWIMEKNSDSIYRTMKEYAINRSPSQKQFNAKKFNQEIINQLNDLIQDSK